MNKQDKKDLGVKIAKERHAKKLTQFKLSELTGISFRTIQHMEYGKSGLGLPFLLRLDKYVPIKKHIMGLFESDVVINSDSTTEEKKLQHLFRLWKKLSFQEKVIFFNSITK